MLYFYQYLLQEEWMPLMLLDVTCYAQYWAVVETQTLEQKLWISNCNVGYSRLLWRQPNSWCVHTYSLKTNVLLWNNILGLVHGLFLVAWHCNKICWVKTVCLFIKRSLKMYYQKSLKFIYFASKSKDAFWKWTENFLECM